MNHRLALLLSLTLVGSGGVAGVACSSSSSGSVADDGGADGSASDGSQGGDAARDGAFGSDTGASDGGSQDATGDQLTGNCAPVKGACDIVLQNCGAGKECVVSRGSDGGFATACFPTTNNEHIPMGSPCCPGAQNPCLPGLECLGASCQGDAAPTSRCAPHCCTGDDSICGQSPEGYPGHCDTNVNSGGSNPVDLFEICTYSAVCKPFGIIACPSGTACEVLDNLGSAKCDNIYNPADSGPGGAKEGDPCAALNQCADGLMCFGSNNADKCKMLCLIANSSPPFDAGALDGAPLHGGCTQGKSCVGVSASTFPSWLGLCE
jgi:hypothetical protein